MNAFVLAFCVMATGQLNPTCDIQDGHSPTKELCEKFRDAIKRNTEIDRTGQPTGQTLFVIKDCIEEFVVDDA